MVSNASSALQKELERKKSVINIAELTGDDEIGKAKLGYSKRMTLLCSLPKILTLFQACLEHPKTVMRMQERRLLRRTHLLEMLI